MKQGTVREWSLLVNPGGDLALCCGWTVARAHIIMLHRRTIVSIVSIVTILYYTEQSYTRPDNKTGR